MKKGKIKIAVKAASFLLILVLLIGSAQKILVKRSTIDKQFIPPFYEERENSLDAVYIGSSNCYAFWNSSFAWREYGICVYPYSSNGQPFYAAEYLIKEARKTQKDAVYIVNINTVFDDTVPFDHFHNLINVMPDSVNKLQMIDHLCDMGDYSLKERWEFYLPIIRFHSRWSEVSGDDIGGTLSTLKGATTTSLYLDKVEDVSNNFVSSDKEGILPQKVIDSTNSLLDYCDEEKLKVLFVTVPQSVGDKARIERYNALNALIRSRGYETLCLEDKIEEMGINLKVDYYNGEHTNIHGSVKFTHYLSEYLVKNYGFKDKRGNKEYDDWNKAAEEYSEIADSRIFPWELDIAHRDYTLEMPEISLIKEKKNINISWERVKGADGYAVWRKHGSNGTWKEIGTTDKLKFSDSKLNMESEYYYYTVVPFRQEEGTRYYGDCYYHGTKIKP